MSGVSGGITKARLAVAKKAYKIFPDIANISTPSGPVNAGDGTFTEGATGITDVPCEYTPLSAYERQMSAGALGGYVDYKLEFPYYFEGELLNIPATASVTVQERDVHPALTFSVVGQFKSSSEMTLVVAAKLEG